MAYHCVSMMFVILGPLPQAVWSLCNWSESSFCIADSKSNFFLLDGNLLPLSLRIESLLFANDVVVLASLSGHPHQALGWFCS